MFLYYSDASAMKSHYIGESSLAGNIPNMCRVIGLALNSLTGNIPNML